MCECMCVCVRACLCVRARARVCVCLCVCVDALVSTYVRVLFFFYMISDKRWRHYLSRVKSLSKSI